MAEAIVSLAEPKTRSSSPPRAPTAPPPPGLGFLLVRSGLRAASALAPPLAASVATRLFLTPARSRDVPLPPGGHRFQLQTGEGLLSILSWGSGPTALIQHGWGSRASHTGALVQALLRQGFSVIAPDAPAHGDSEGRVTTIAAMARALLAVARRVWPVDVLVGHSAGAAAATLALADGLQARRAVFLAPMTSGRRTLQDWSRAMNVGPWVLPGIEQRISRAARVPFEALELARLAPKLRVPLLVLHDPEDLETPFDGSAGLVRAWPSALLEEAPGLGHRRILRSPEIAARAAAFLAR